MSKQYLRMQSGSGTKSIDMTPGRKAPTTEKEAPTPSTEAQGDEPHPADPPAPFLNEPPPESAESCPQIRILPPSSLPVFRLEINKKSYTISGLSVDITTEGGAADIRVSLEVESEHESAGKRASNNSEVTDMVKSIKSSIKSSKMKITGAASKLFRKSSSSSKSPSQQPVPGVDCGSCSLDQDCEQGVSAGGADIDQLDGTVSSNGNAGEPDSSAGASAGDTGLTTSLPGKVRSAFRSASQENILDSDSGGQGQQSVSGSLDDTPSSAAKSLSIYSKAKALRQRFTVKTPTPVAESEKTQGVAPTSTAAVSPAFPHTMPQAAKNFFQVDKDTRLLATVYAADTSSLADALEAERLAILPDPKKHKLKLQGGKTRSVWLSPTAGEKVEAWKVYLDEDKKCSRVLGRLPGTDLYGYTLALEIDRGKQFARKEEKDAYEKSLGLLQFSDQDVYEVEEQEPVEETAEVYM